MAETHIRYGQELQATAAPRRKRIHAGATPLRFLRTLVVAVLAFGLLALAPAVRPVASQAAGPAHLSLRILSDKMSGKAGWPKYSPAYFTLPAHTLVQITIRNFDEGAAAVPPTYNIVKGTVGGTMRVIAGTASNPNPRAGTVVKALSPKGVAHTFTIMTGTGVLVNVPVPSLSTIVFTFRTPGPGTYSWACLTACGTGPSGYGGPMATPGWMHGTMTVR
jgi:hypothetical protein